MGRTLLQRTHFNDVFWTGVPILNEIKIVVVFRESLFRQAHTGMTRHNEQFSPPPQKKTYDMT